MTLAKRMPGETPWDAILNHNGMDVDEEVSFRRFVIGKGGNEGAPLEMLEFWFEEWETRQKS